MRKLKVLCCDDQLSHLKVLEEIVLESGHFVETISSPEEIVDKNEIEKYDVIITDFNMPGMDGIEFATLIKKKKKEILVIIISNQNPLVKEFEFGIDDNIKVVFKGDTTMECIQTHLHNYYAKTIYKETGSYMVI